MAEFTSSALQNVLTGQNVLFTETPVCGSGCIVHRDGSGIVTLRGLTNQCFARYRVTFGANIAAPAGGTPAVPISIAIALEGEGLASATATVTPSVVAQFNNVFAAAFVNVPRGCCVTVSVENVSTQAIDVQNANLIVERVA